MKVKEIIENIDNFTAEQRATTLQRLIDLLSPPSLEELRQFQMNWNGKQSFTKFKKAQNSLIRKCIELELTQLGKTARQVLNLPGLNMDTDI